MNENNKGSGCPAVSPRLGRYRSYLFLHVLVIFWGPAIPFVLAVITRA